MEIKFTARSYYTLVDFHTGRNHSNARPREHVVVVLRVAEGTDLLRPDASARDDGVDAYRLARVRFHDDGLGPAG